MVDIVPAIGFEMPGSFATPKEQSHLCPCLSAGDLVRTGAGFAYPEGFPAEQFDILVVLLNARRGYHDPGPVEQPGNPTVHSSRLGVWLPGNLVEGQSTPEKRCRARHQLGVALDTEEHDFAPSELQRRQCLARH